MGCGHLFAIMVAMGREILLEELDRLLGFGYPLLAVFPVQPRQGFLLQLLDSVSVEMRWYADEVASRASGTEDYWDFRRGSSTFFLVGWVKDMGAVLLGWCAVGVLK